MNKQELMEIIDAAPPHSEEEIIVNNIKEFLNGMQIDDDEEIEGIDAVDEFVKNGGYNGRSRLANSGREAYEDLEKIRSQLHTWSAWRNKFALKDQAVKTMNKKTKAVMIIFISFIIALAVLAVVFTVLNIVYGDNYLYGKADAVAELIGTVDFVLGATGFVWERFDDMKKVAVVSEIDGAIQTNDRERFVKVINKIDNSHHNVHSICGGKVIDNRTIYSQAEDKRHE